MNRLEGTRASAQAARELELAVEAQELGEAEELLGATDCPHGCSVEPDGSCAHGWRSAALSAGLV
jgi:hypothetical protein